MIELSLDFVNECLESTVEGSSIEIPGVRPLFYQGNRVRAECLLGNTILLNLFHPILTCLKYFEKMKENIFFHRNFIPRKWYLLVIQFKQFIIINFYNLYS